MEEFEEFLKGKKDEDTIWVENLLSGDSIFRSEKTKEKYPMAPKGFVGSVVSVPVKVAKESFFLRAVRRGNLRFVTDAEFSELSMGLVFQEDAASDSNNIMKALERGASEVGARYTKEGLTDDGTEGRSIPARQIHSHPSNKGPSTVRRSSAAPVQVGEEPAEIPVVLTEKVKEGDWQSDVG